MIVVETCPKCGHDLHDVVICTYPPIPRKVCWNCGWSWTGKPEKTTRVPFGGNTDTSTDKDNTSTSWNGSSTDWDSIDIKTSTNWDSIDIKTLTDWASTNIETSSTINNAFCKNPCENCPNNPKNGGDGVCFCILGQQNIVY